MNAPRQVVFGIVAALLSSAILFGGFALSLLESGTPLGMAPTSAAMETMTGFPIRDGETVNGTTGRSAAPTLTIVSPASPLPTNCPPPAGWFSITLLGDETLEVIAAKYSTAPAALQWANCLGETTTLIAGSILYVPPLQPTATSTPTPTASATIPPSETSTNHELATATIAVCSPPQGWVLYQIKPGDTLYGLSRILNVSVGLLQQANCLGASTSLRVGQSIYLPYLPLPSATPSRAPTDTALPPTARPPLPPTATYTPLPTATSVPPTPTAPKPTATATQPTATTEPATSTVAPTSPPPETAIPEITPFPLPTATFTEEPPASPAFQVTPAPSDGQVNP